MVKLAIHQKILLFFALLAVCLMTLVYFLPHHSKSGVVGGSPCLFKIVTNSGCTKEIGDSSLVNQHLPSLQSTFTAIPSDFTALIAIAVLAFGLVVFLHRERKHIELYIQTIVKQKWREHQFIEVIFDPIKKALRSGILERKEPSLVIA